MKSDITYFDKRREILIDLFDTSGTTIHIDKGQISFVFDACIYTGFVELTFDQHTLCCWLALWEECYGEAK